MVQPVTLKEIRMSDEPEQGDDEEVIRAPHHVADVVPRRLTKRTPAARPVEQKSDPENLLGEQRQMQNVLEASAQAGVAPSELLDRLARAKDHLSAESDTESE